MWEITKRLIFPTAMLALTGCSMYHTEAQSINMGVVYSMRYTSDQEQYGVSDLWVEGCPSKGDCEDASLCLMSQIEEQLPQSPRPLLFLCEMDGIGHTIVKHDGWWYDSTDGYYGQRPPCPLITPLGRNIDSVREVRHVIKR